MWKIADLQDMTSTKLRKKKETVLPVCAEKYSTEFRS